MRLWPEMRVVILGSWADGRDILLHHALRNTRHALYIAPNTTQDAPSSVALQKVGVRMTVLQRCLYCNESDAGVKDLYSGLLKEAVKEVKEWAPGLSLSKSFKCSKN